MMDSRFLKSLISGTNTFDAVFKHCIKGWQCDNTGSISQFFEKQEREFNLFEDFLRETYYEFYQILYENIKTTRPEDRLSPEDKIIIILDGLSLREASLLVPELKNNGYEITEYSYNLSTIPSDTQTFVHEIFGASSLSFLKQWKDYKVQYISAGQIPKFLHEDENLIIWLSFPDELLHYARGQVITPVEAFNKTKEVLFAILKLLEKDEILITSDHGYIYAKTASLFWKLHHDDEKILKQIFKAGRSVKIEDIDANNKTLLNELKKIPEPEGIIISDEKHLYIKGRYWWSIPGRQSDICHGGLSLMECLVPRLRIKKV